jgi:hypothetical protein
MIFLFFLIHDKYADSKKIIYSLAFSSADQCHRKNVKRQKQKKVKIAVAQSKT